MSLCACKWGFRGDCAICGKTISTNVSESDVSLLSSSTVFLGHFNIKCDSFLFMCMSYNPWDLGPSQILKAGNASGKEKDT
jgi:hypothetical protein